MKFMINKLNTEINEVRSTDENLKNELGISKLNFSKIEELFEENYVSLIHNDTQIEILLAESANNNVLLEFIKS